MEIFTSKRANELITILKKFNLSEVLEIERRLDKQYEYLVKLNKRVKNCKIFLSLIILNAISSYALNCTGEDYWGEFSEFFSCLYGSRDNVSPREIIESFKSFLVSSRCNKRYLEIKIRRVEKLYDFLERLSKDLDKYLYNYDELWRDLSSALGSRRDAKTIVFAVKMFNYGARICLGNDLSLPMNIPIPVDHRIEIISERLGVRKKVTDFWNSVARITGIPPLHLDSLLWIAYRYVKKGERSGDEKFDELIGSLARIIKER